MSKRELKSLTGTSKVTTSRDKGRLLRSAGRTSSGDSVTMSVKELTTRVGELERELERARQTAEDRTRELETSRHAADTATAKTSQ